MELLSWLWWLVAKIVGLAFGLVWFLLGGWVATLAQIGVIAFLIFGYKYGWRQAPQELLARAGPAGRYVWGWLRTRSPISLPERAAKRERRTESDMNPRRAQRKELGDVNISTVLSVVALGGILLVFAA